MSYTATESRHTPNLQLLENIYTAENQYGIWAASKPRGKRVRDLGVSMKYFTRFGFAICLVPLRATWSLAFRLRNGASA
ncbi:hypothetical protein FPOAC1_008018 [Fusarium poae]|uniref:hypothetical protein n=1 Tax=Fusarium poae TaxID=36050 RepID=UPI001CEA3273|nr:hypothetical protein FPOAC1_008018 [Fusarium poae]KAG8668635.1 hypothetical protein FPOAC1_008018 [Fusarium poae]